MISETNWLTFNGSNVRLGLDALVPLIQSKQIPNGKAAGKLGQMGLSEHCERWLCHAGLRVSLQRRVLIWRMLSVT